MTVLFVDLVGSTPLAEGRDPEDVRSMLGEYFAGASAAVERHGGVVEKFIGDAVMAVWGTPVAHEDDAERAVRAALEIVDGVAALGGRLGVPLQARVGVLGGEAVAALDAVGQGLVTGDLVNTASRLQSAAEPGTVLVGESTYRAANQAIAFSRLEPLTLKGKSEKVPAWRALRVVSEVGGSGRGLAPEPPFVGRDDDLRLAKESLHATGREGRARLLSVTGVAGIGKSRLLWELLKYIDGITEDIYWHQGRCPSYGEGVTFWALAEMVRRRAGIAEIDDDATARARLEESLEANVEDEEERRWMQPRLGHLLGLDPAPSGDRDELFAAWRRYFERVAGHGTAVLAFEDLHWADPGLLDFIESVLLESRGSPVLVVSLARPELLERRPAWGGGGRSTVSMHLEPLSPASIRDLVTGYVEGLPEEGLDRIVARSEGIPLYAVETVRTLADRGVLEQDGERYRVVGELGDTLDIPETLHALVAARLDALPEAERSLVLDASVVGHSFTPEALIAVSGRTPEMVTELLGSLTRKEILDRDTNPRSPERGQFNFVQAVIREVAYSTLSKPARRAKHRATAEWFIGLDEDELAGVVASHLLDAYHADPSAADAEEVAAQARDWLTRAGTRALSLGSPAAALLHATQGLALATTPQERAPLLGLAASSAAYVGDLEQAGEHFVAASEAYRVLDRPEDEGRLLADATRFNFEGDIADDLTRRLDELEQRLVVDSGVRALVLSRIADIAAVRGDPRRADETSERALIMAEKINDEEILTQAASSRSWALSNNERQFESLVLSEAVVALADRGDNITLQFVSRIRHGVLCTNSDPRGAIRFFMEGADLAHRIGLTSGEMGALGNAVETALDVGDIPAATEALNRAQELATDRPPADRDSLTLTQAQLLAYQGDPAAAAALLDQLAQERLEHWAVVQLRTWYYRIRGVVCLIAGDPESALAASRQTVALEPSGANANTGLWGTVLAGARLRDAESIRQVLGETHGLRGAWVEMVRRTGEATVAVLDGTGGGDVDAAAAQMEQALKAWRDNDFPLDHALAACIASWILPPHLVPQDEVESAKAFLEAIGARGLLTLF